ncbi:hypothetical protein ACF1BQ_027575 [Bradyrhizobium sp. RDT10]
MSTFSAPTAILADSASFLLAAALLSLVPSARLPAQRPGRPSYSAKWPKG